MHTRASLAKREQYRRQRTQKHTRAAQQALAIAGARLCRRACFRVASRAARRDFGELFDFFRRASRRTAYALQSCTACLESHLSARGQ
jgi:hypothetical protein